GAAVAVTGGWREALDVSSAHPDVVVVTMTGDRFSHVTWRLGANGPRATAAALDDARRRASVLDSDVVRLGHAVRQATAALEAARSAEATATRRLDAHDAELGATAVALARRQQELREIEQLVSNDRSARHAAAQRQEQEALRIGELETALGRLEADE